MRFRIDGVLHEVYKMPLGVFVAVTARIKVLARLDLTERRRPQDGRVKTRTPDGREIELRISSLPTAFGEKIVMRIFDPEVLVRSFDAMGFAGVQKATWDRLVRQPHGIVLVTGPTGSGKTTTLYSTLKTIAGPTLNVCTIEDPIELIEPAFNQMQVNSSIDLTFATGIRSLLRQDPDIIMVGEIRDLEAAEIAVQAALTGHLVLSTLHTNDAPSAVTRLLDLGAPPYLVKATLLGVLAQRLVRRLCPYLQAAEPAAGDRLGAVFRREARAWRGHGDRLRTRRLRCLPGYGVSRSFWAFRDARSHRSAARGHHQPRRPDTSQDAGRRRWYGEPAPVRSGARYWRARPVSPRSCGSPRPRSRTRVSLFLSKRM